MIRDRLIVTWMIFDGPGLTLFQSKIWKYFRFHLLDGQKDQSAKVGGLNETKMNGRHGLNGPSPTFSQRVFQFRSGLATFTSL